MSWIIFFKHIFLNFFKKLFIPLFLILTCYIFFIHSHTNKDLKINEGGINMPLFNNSNQPDSSKRLDSNNLKVLKDQLNYEATMNKKASHYANLCNDRELEMLCNDLAESHKQNFTDLLDYLNSHE